MTLVHHETFIAASMTVNLHINYPKAIKPFYMRINRRATLLVLCADIVQKVTVKSLGSSEHV